MEIGSLVFEVDRPVRESEGKSDRGAPTVELNARLVQREAGPRL